MTYSSYAPLVFANGYMPLPIRPNGKAPYTPDISGKSKFLDWNQAPIDLDLINGWIASGLGDYGLGIRLGSDLIAIDIDITDDTTAMAVHALAVQHLGPGLCRIGKAPKCLLLYRIEWLPVTYKKRIVKLNAPKQAVEVLADGQQFVAYGIHPDTQQPFIWLDPDRSPLTVPASALPLVTKAQLDEFLDVILPANVAVREKPQVVQAPAPVVEAVTGTTAQQAYADTCLTNSLNRLAATHEGSRNNQLNIDAHLCFGLVKAGLLDYTHVYDALEAVALNIGLDKAEVRATLLSAWRGAEARHIPNRPYTRPVLGVDEAAAVFGNYGEPAPLDTASADSLQIIDDSDRGLAVILKQRTLGQFAKWVEKQESWYLWNGSRWQADPGAVIKSHVSSFCALAAASETQRFDEKIKKVTDQKEMEALYRELRRKVKHLQSAATISNVERLSRTLEDQHIGADVFDAQPHLLGLPDATLDLDTGTIRPGRHEDFITKAAGTSPNKGGGCPLWHAFLSRIFSNDPDMISFIQRLFGYCLTADISENKFFFCYGTGRNGKSVLFNILTAMLGDYSRNLPSEALVKTRFERHPTSIAALVGSRVVTAAEIPAGSQWNAELLKQLTGNDLITARKMAKDDFQFRAQFKLFITGNEAPDIGKIDEGLRRRLVLIPFEVTIPVAEQDSKLEQKLLAELPAIMAWAIEGLAEWRRIGLAIPNKVLEASAEYIDSEDELGDFIDAVLMPDPTAGMLPYNQIYQAYVHWCGRESVVALSKRRFCKQLRSRQGFKTIRTDSQRGVTGYRFRMDGIY